MLFSPEFETKIYRVKFVRHLKLLMWKSYVQRTRRWRLAAVQTVFAGLMFLMAVFAAKPVFLTPLQDAPRAALTAGDIMTTLSAGTLLGYAPDTEPYNIIMKKVGTKLNKVLITGSSEQDLDEKLYEMSKGQVLRHHVIWVVWREKEMSVWKFSIRSTELAHLASSMNATVTTTLSHNRHLRSGFLAVQLAVSEAILATEAKTPLRHKIKLKSMPISPLMRKEAVRQAMVWILLCFTVAFVPPVMEVSELVVHETSNEFKRGLVMRNVGAACIYLGWLSYLLMTALPVLTLATLALILIFRWVWLFLAFLFLATYITIMAMTAFIMCMFQRKSHIAAIWSALFTFLQLFLADLLVHHGFDGTTSFTIVLHILLPPLGLVHGFNEFALLQTGRAGLLHTNVYENHTVIIWIVMIFIYFGVLMMFQRTIGNDRAIGGQVSWRSIIFKQAEDRNKLRVIQNPSGNERDPLQEVDELLAKAISFRSVSKSVMGIGILRKITMDVYRGEYTQCFAEKIQERMLLKIEDLITGLTLPDEGSVNMLGNSMSAISKEGKRVTAMHSMLGYCHRMGFLVSELTVEETLRFFIQLCLWDQSDEEVEGYSLIHIPRLYKECDLQDVQNTLVCNLGHYYKAQLCWAIAIILEPRIVFIQSYTDGQKYVSVINDKIVKYRTHLTIVKISFSTSLLEHADRVFLFDHKVLVFGGSPAYMFFKYGREYRVRMTFRARISLDNTNVEDLVIRAIDMGGQVRAYFGTLLILRLPTTPTDKTAEFVQDITENAITYGITSLNISLPDSEEIHKRAINESRKQISSYITNSGTEISLREISKAKVWKRETSLCLNQLLLRQTVWKYVSFYIHYRLFLIITILTAIVTGAIIGVFLSFQLNDVEDTMAASKMLGEMMTVEALKQSTTLVLKVHNTDDAISIATGYTMSHTNANPKETKNMDYTALPFTESLVEYLMLRAIDSPQHYVYEYAYGMEVKDEGGVLLISVLYSPIHHDTAAAVRSLSRIYMALLRHYTKTLDADIQVSDDPLVLDSSMSLRKTKVPPLVIHFMLIITIAHITLLPTMESGLIRHMQVHAMNFSPARYWFSLFCCDIVLYWTLVFIITSVLFFVMYLVAPVHFLHRDLIVIPFMLIMYGFSCIPQAYLFSLGPSAALNSMSFVISNIIFGEASVVSQFIRGDAFAYAEKALSLSPQYNVANAFVQITKIFVYNSECVVFRNKKLCKSNVLHKCCKKCGIMQACFERISYLSTEGILDEILWTIYHSIIFSSLLAIWEYRVPHRLWYYSRKWWFSPVEPLMMIEEAGAAQERMDVEAKTLQMQEKKTRRNIKIDTFGENLLVHNLSERHNGMNKLSRVSFGVGKGEALSLVGLSANSGRLTLCEILGGYKMPTSGCATAISKWSLAADPHKYCRNVAFSCFERVSLPPWMTVYDAMWMMAVLRGIPKQYVDEEVMNLLEALELDEALNVNVFRLHQNEKSRLNFAVAVIGAPPVLVLDEFTAYQQYSVDRAMFFILYHLRKQGHALVVSSASVEIHMAVTNKLGILVNGQLVDVDHVDNLVARYSPRGYTVVVHLKDEVNVTAMFSRHFKDFTINDVSDVSLRQLYIRGQRGDPRGSDKLGILVNGQLVDEGHVDILVARYSPRGYTVVVHLKDEVNVTAMFSRHFKDFTINDVSDVSLRQLSIGNVEIHMAVTNKPGILVNGQLVDVDHVDNLVARYSPQGYTVVVHLKDEVNVTAMFSRHFKDFTINDVSDVLANVQVKDSLNYGQIFGKMEELLKANSRVYSYVITVTAMDYIYNDIIDKGTRIQTSPDDDFWPCMKFFGNRKKTVDMETFMGLETFPKKYDIATLKELPWSVIFQR